MDLLKLHHSSEQHKNVEDKDIPKDELRSYFQSVGMEKLEIGGRQRYPRPCSYNF